VLLDYFSARARDADRDIVIGGIALVTVVGLISWQPAAKSSMPIPKAGPPAIASRSPSSPARCYRNTLAILLLDELAGEMGRALEQEEIHIAYADRTWTLTAARQPNR
jgi:hypothetical protein